MENDNYPFGLVSAEREAELDAEFAALSESERNHLFGDWAADCAECASERGESPCCNGLAYFGVCECGR